MKYWEIPKLWKNETVVILGGGPSLPHVLSGRAILTHPVIGINNAYKLGSWVDICFFGDARWFWWNCKELETYGGLKITCNRKHSSETVPSIYGIPSIKIIKSYSKRGINTAKDTVNFNSSSGGAAINLAWHLGAKRILLVGYDMRRINGVANWDEHILPKTDKPYTNFINPFFNIAKDATRLGLEILNATPGSMLPFFPFVKFEDYV